MLWVYISLLRLSGLCNVFLTFLDLLLVQAGHYFSRSIFSILCHVFTPLVFLHVFLYVVDPYLHLVFGRPQFLLPETSSDFAQMWLSSRLKQWPNHFSLLFYRNVSRGFMCASFLMSSFLMLSNLVLPLARLNMCLTHTKHRCVINRSCSPECTTSQ